ncbi:MAG: hypothetical protein CM1200mP14_17250 [Gammaproteobacteria bacterium]|nr:MAG: hypothetical protein CM1200mP14_17250 [Gammaproteobacteria bacterium]
MRPYRPSNVPDHPIFELEDDLRRALASRGLFETQTPAFVPESEGDVQVANPLHPRNLFYEERSYLRCSAGLNTISLMGIGSTTFRDCDFISEGWNGRTAS